MPKAATDMPTASRHLLPGSQKTRSTNYEKRNLGDFPNLGGALDNRTAMGKDYPAQL
jgi:hypothetical protein